MAFSSIGYIKGGKILSEIGDIHRFSNPSKLLAYAGLVPSVYQFENFQTKRTRMSKRGSKPLRYALMNAAHNVAKSIGPSEPIPILRWPKAVLTTMLLGIVSARPSE